MDELALIKKYFYARRYFMRRKPGNGEDAEDFAAYVAAEILRKGKNARVEYLFLNFLESDALNYKYIS